MTVARELIIVIALTSLWTGVRSYAQDAGAKTFTNPIGVAADPWVIYDADGKRFLWCFSTGNLSISIHASPNLHEFGPGTVVWRAPETGPYSKEVWAPELHKINGRWYVYVGASDGQNANHLTYVLESKTDDPLGEYTLRGPMATGEGSDGRSPNIWAIDMTILVHRDRMYALWSGWDAPGTDRQFLYIAPMKSPTELAGPRVRVANNADYEWERTEPGKEGRGLNEGPEVLKRNGRTFVVYSCAASWLPSYKLGMLELVGDDPLQPSSWKKSPEPVFQGTSATYGVGHSCFVQMPAGDNWYHVFHAKLTRDPGWYRGVFIQPMSFKADGTPEFGTPVDPGKPMPIPH